MKPSHDDIVEYALNHGTKASSEKYGIPYEEAVKIVAKFTREIDGDCSCTNAYKLGICQMCFICDKPLRI